MVVESKSEIWRRAVAINGRAGFPPLRQAKRRAALRGRCCVRACMGGVGMLGMKRGPYDLWLARKRCKQRQSGDDAAGNNKSGSRQLIRDAGGHACASAAWIGAAPKTRSLGRSVDCEKNRAGEGEHIKRGGGGEVVNRRWRRHGEKKRKKGEVEAKRKGKEKANRDRKGEMVNREGGKQKREGQDVREEFGREGRSKRGLGEALGEGSSDRQWAEHARPVLGSKNSGHRC